MLRRCFAAAAAIAALLAPSALRATEAEDTYARACAELDNGEYDNAVTHLTMARSEGLRLTSNFYKKLSLAYLRLSAAHAQDSDEGRIYVRYSLETLNEGIGTWPSDPELYYGRAVALEVLDSLPQALSAIDQALALNPGPAEFWSAKAGICEDMGDLAGAEECRARAQGAPPPPPPVPENERLWQEAKQAADADAYALAADRIYRSASIKPRPREDWEWMAMVYGEAGRDRFADSLYSLITGLPLPDPAGVFSFAYRRQAGDVARAAGAHRHAIRHFRIALEYSPNDESTWVAMAGEYRALGLADSADYYLARAKQPAAPASPGLEQALPVSGKNIQGYNESAPGKDGVVMVLIPAGEFTMGVGKGELDETSQPKHKVWVSAYWIDKYEVTNRQYKRFCDATGHAPPEDPIFDGYHAYFANFPDRPVVNVTCDDAAAYAAWAGKRLPTEAEWEKAARGTDGRKYPWGSSGADDGGALRANFNAAGSGRDDGWEKMAPVGSYQAGASPYGVMDMAGNVGEWCSDYYKPYYYRESPKRDPQGPAEGSYHVTRGGSWRSSPAQLHSAMRGEGHYTWAVHTQGFRCALSAQE